MVIRTHDMTSFEALLMVLSLHGRCTGGACAWHCGPHVCMAQLGTSSSDCYNLCNNREEGSGCTAGDIEAATTVENVGGGDQGVPGAATWARVMAKEEALVWDEVRRVEAEIAEIHGCIDILQNDEHETMAS